MKTEEVLSKIESGLSGINKLLEELTIERDTLKMQLADAQYWIKQLHYPNAPSSDSPYYSSVFRKD